MLKDIVINSLVGSAVKCLNVNEKLITKETQKYYSRVTKYKVKRGVSILEEALGSVSVYVNASVEKKPSSNPLFVIYTNRMISPGGRLYGGY